MKSTSDYLKEAKEKLQIESDYALAKWLGVTRASASNWKNGRNVMDNYTAVRIAEVLEIPAIEIIAVAEMEREKVSERREFWKKIAVGGVAICVTLVLLNQLLVYDEKILHCSDVIYIMRSWIAAFVVAQILYSTSCTPMQQHKFPA